jgi:hypothetical protein
VHRQSQLPNIIAAGHPAGRLASRLYSRQQQANQDPDNGDDDKQFNERKREPAMVA